MANPVAGTCKCPLCHEDGAEVREGAKGALYIVCLGCCSQIRTLSRQGRTLIAGLLQPCAAEHKGEASPPPPKPPKVPDLSAVDALPPKPAPKKEKASWFSPPVL